MGRVKEIQKGLDLPADATARQVRIYTKLWNK